MRYLGRRWQVSDYQCSKPEATQPCELSCQAGVGTAPPSLTGRVKLSVNVCGCSEAYPGCVVTRVHFCYDVRTLIDLDDQR
jgi:hypothetical protein